MSAPGRSATTEARTGPAVAPRGQAAGPDVTGPAAPARPAPPALPVASGRESARVLRRVLLRRPWAAAGSLVTLVLVSVAGLLQPLAIGRVVDAVAAGDGAGVRAGILWIGGAAVAQAALLTAADRLVLTVTEHAIARLRESALAAALRAEPDALAAGGSGDLLARVTGDVERLSEVAGSTIAAFVSAGLTIAISLGGLLALDWPFALAGALGVPVQLLTLRWYLRSSGPVYRATRSAESARTGTLLGYLSGASTVRRLGSRAEAVEAVEATSRDALRREHGSVVLATRFYGRLNVAELLGLGAILVTGFLLVRSDRVPLGDATAAALVFLRLFDPINVLLGLFDSVQQAASSLTRVVGLLGVRPKRPRVRSDTVTPGDSGVGSSGRAAAIRLADVRVTFEGRRVALDDVSLDIEPGCTVAVVGSSGAGKTTLARVVAGLIAPGAGEVVVDGVVVADGGGGGQGVPAGLVMLTQEARVLSGPIAEDLRLADPLADDARLTWAVREAGAGAWLDSLPEGLATVVGPLGLPLSAAQVQHLALARAFLVAPSVVVLDEATADAGSAAARGLEAAAARLVAGRTALVVAHRLTQASVADLVVVMDRGRIVEQGTHDELLDRRGSTYSRLWAAWTGSRGAAQRTRG